MCRIAISTRFIVLLLSAFVIASQGMSEPPSNANRSVSGGGIIDRVITTGSVPVFRADGYTIRITPATQVRFGKGLQTLSEVGTNTFAIFTGKPDASGAIVATKAAFAKVKLPRRKPDPNAIQVTTFPSGSVIDADDGFKVGLKSFSPQDYGGWCGWYSIPDNPVEQEQVRRLGMRLVPQYQRDLPDDDPAKIPFRFYMVEDDYIRSDIFCNNGLVLVPAAVVNRLQSEDQLAAVLADGVAGELQLQAVEARGFTFTRTEAAELVAVGLASFGGDIPAVIAGNTANIALQGKTVRDVEHERGRMAIALIFDAGFNPQQAPEAWRLLAPARLPKNPSNLKYPEKSRNLQSILATYDNSTALGGAAPQVNETATTVPIH